MRHLLLGASLYVPATRHDLASIGVDNTLRSVIFCTEDAIAAPDVGRAIENIGDALPRLGPGPLRFVRVRDVGVLERLLEARGIENLDGFVIPKATLRSLPRYLAALEGTDFVIMPTLETAEAFDATELRRLRRLFTRSDVQPRILTIRVGGNDLLRTLGLRRPTDATIYETVLGPLLAQIIATFKPAGFNLSAPVFEGLAHADTLRAEAERDLGWGFFGKTAIHPVQVPVIESAYVVSESDYAMATEILDPEAPAVFRMCDTMCEVSTHARWAETMLARARIYGVERQLALVNAPS